MVIKKLLFFSLICFALACSNKQRQEQSEIRSLYAQGLCEDALKFLERSELKKNEENSLLYHLYQGKILYCSKRYFEAAEIFTKAQDVMDKLYTQSIKRLILRGVISESKEDFRGKIYERSMLYYYQTQSYLNIYNEGKVTYLEKVKKEYKKVERTLSSQEKTDYLYRARATILAWDSFFNSLRNEGVETINSSDLMVKIFGAQVHELINSRNDNQISLQLYRDAKKILESHYNSLASYNEKASVFHEKFFYKERIKDDDQKATWQKENLLKYLNTKIIHLTSIVRPFDLKKVQKELDPKGEIKLIKNQNVKRIIIEEKMISPLEAKKLSYNLRTALNNIENPTTRALAQGIGIPILTYFAMGPLGLGVFSQSQNTSVMLRHNLGEELTKEVGIEFEMPYVKELDKSSWSKVLISKKELTSGLPDPNNIVMEKALALITPLSDLAHIANKEIITSTYSARGLRIALKHIVAIITAYQTYKKLQEQSGELFARPAAFAQYVASAKVIRESERVDTRQWAILASNYHLFEVDLSPGSYYMYLSDENHEQLKLLNKLEITSQESEILSFNIN